MELIAVVNGLKALKTVNQTVTIYIDSKYVSRGVNEWLPEWIRGWYGQHMQILLNVVNR